MNILFGVLIPVLAYGVLCVLLGFWVQNAITNHWPTMGQDVSERLHKGMKALRERIGA